MEGKTLGWEAASHQEKSISKQPTPFPFSNKVEAVGSYKLQSEVSTEKDGKQEHF